jgi:hypothetical protein
MSDEQRHPLEPKAVGKGLDAPRHNPADPQAYLAGSNHPYAPFPGNALKWESRVWDDGTTYALFSISCLVLGSDKAQLLDLQ